MHPRLHRAALLALATLLHAAPASARGSEREATPAATPRAAAGATARSAPYALDTSGYHDFAALSRELDQLTKAAGKLARKVSLGRTRGGRDLWVVAVGADAASLQPPSGHAGEIRDDAAHAPGLLVAGGVGATQIAGSEAALRFLARMVNDYGRVDSVTRLLDRVTVYVIPRLSPDACEHFFDRPLAERTTNETPTDDDRDGRMDEDRPRDLNGDGLVTVMRVEDPEGEWLPDPADPRLLRRADRAQGESGRYQLYTEGGDSDGRYAEDGPGGVDFSRNFPFGYRPFSLGAGIDPMTEIENRAPADFLFDHASVAAVFVFGPQDNLAQPWKADPAAAGALERALAAGRRQDSDGRTGYGGRTAGLPATAASAGRRGRGSRAPDEAPPDPWVRTPPADDADLYEFLSRQYRKLTGAKDVASEALAEGDLGSFVYYDLGRWAFSARSWVPTAPDSARADSAGAARGKDVPPGDRAARSGRGMRGGPRAGGGPGGPAGGSPKHDQEPHSDAPVLKALTALGIDALVPWTRVEHPDFPGKVVEVGGFRPYVRSAPPAALLDTLSTGFDAFLVDLAGRLPEMRLRDTKVEKLGSGLYRLSTQVTNAGFLPTLPVMGSVTRWSRNLRVRAAGAPKLVSGHEIQVLEPIAGGGHREASWVVLGEPGARSASPPTARWRARRPRR